MANSTETREMQMQLALDACSELDKPNFSAIARQFPPVNRQTLKRRFYGEQDLRAFANSLTGQNLSIE
jgi:flagellar motor protein MotB